MICEGIVTLSLKSMAISGIAVAQVAGGLPSALASVASLGVTLRATCHCERAERARHSPAWQLRRREGVTPASTSECRSARSDISSPMSLRASAASAAISRTAEVQAEREIPRFARYDINSCLCRCARNDISSPMSLRASAASAAISRTAVMRTEWETPVSTGECRSVRSDINSCLCRCARSNVNNTITPTTTSSHRSHPCTLP